MTSYNNLPSGNYTESLTLDYPSISQINYVAQKNSFIILFAIVPEYKEIYSSMANLVTGSSVEILEKDSKNIVSIIRERYKGMTSTIQVCFIFTTNEAKIILALLFSFCMDILNRGKDQQV
jgi:hypothetical protein